MIKFGCCFYCITTPCILLSFYCPLCVSFLCWVHFLLLVHQWNSFQFKSFSFYIAHTACSELHKLFVLWLLCKNNSLHSVQCALGFRAFTVSLYTRVSLCELFCEFCAHLVSLYTDWFYAVYSLYSVCPHSAHSLHFAPCTQHHHFVQSLSVSCIVHCTTCSAVDVFSAICTICTCCLLDQQCLLVSVQKIPCKRNFYRGKGKLPKYLSSGHGQSSQEKCSVQSVLVISPFCTQFALCTIEEGVNCPNSWAVVTTNPQN